MASLKAVVVDDNRLNREIVAKILETEGVHTVQAGDAVEGWKQFQVVCPNLVVIDIMLPGNMDGVDLCRMIRTHDKDRKTVVVMVTASDKRKEAERSLAAGADMLIPKPFSPRDFWFQVNSLLAAKKPAKQTRRIFILDSDDAMARQTEQALIKAGCQAMARSEAKGVIRHIKSFGPDVIIMDVDMPEMSGEDLANIIASDNALKTRPIILFYSNRPAEELEALAEKAGVAGFIRKEDGLDAMIMTIKNIFNNG